MPSFPGPLNHLIRKNLRETLSTLDFWCSAVVSTVSLGFRAAGLLPAEALSPVTIMVMFALSTYAQTLFGLEGDGGMTRYRLLPIPGWQVPAAKDVALLLASVVITLPLAPGVSLAAALSALATGHHASVTHHSNQVRWRFYSGVSFVMSVFQVVAMCAAAAAVQTIPLLVLLCAGVYAWSTSRPGRPGLSRVVPNTLVGALHVLSVGPSYNRWEIRCSNRQLLRTFRIVNLDLQSKKITLELHA